MKLNFFLKKEQTRKEPKCSEVITALKPTTGTNAASNVPNTTWWIRKGTFYSNFNRNSSSVIPNQQSSKVPLFVPHLSGEKHYGKNFRYPLKKYGGA